MTDKPNVHPFITYLYSLADAGKRGVLADLRRGLSGAPATTPAMFPYIAAWVPEDARNTWQEKVYYIVAALFAYYQSGAAAGPRLRTDQGNLGSHCRNLAQKEKQSASFEMRFSALLNANQDDLPTFLRQIISLLKGGDIPINWHQLFHDLQRWNSESQYIQRQWANSYWAYKSPVPSETTNQGLE
jgi:CRISPR system Cascade subunit CasB